MPNLPGRAATQRQPTPHPTGMGTVDGDRSQDRRQVITRDGATSDDAPNPASSTSARRDSGGPALLPYEPEGLLEPGARKRARPGSEGGRASQGARPTRPTHIDSGARSMLMLRLPMRARGGTDGGAILIVAFDHPLVVLRSADAPVGAASVSAMQCAASAELVSVDQSQNIDPKRYSHRRVLEPSPRCAMADCGGQHSIAAALPAVRRRACVARLGGRAGRLDALGAFRRRSGRHARCTARGVPLPQRPR